MECAIMCCTCHTLTRSREIVLFFPLVKILQSDGSNNSILGMGKFSYYQIVIEHHELLKYIHMELVARQPLVLGILEEMLSIEFVI